MSHIKKFELFTVLQRERVEALRTHVISWMDALQRGEMLIIGLPQVLGKWEECTTLIVSPDMGDQFLEWLLENSKAIHGPNYLLPPLLASFLCIVADQNFDPRTDEPHPDMSKELKETLVALSDFLTKREEAAETIT